MNPSKIDYEKDIIPKGEYTGSEWIFNRRDRTVNMSKKSIVIVILNIFLIIGLLGCTESEIIPKENIIETNDDETQNTVIEYNIPENLELEYFERTSKSSWYIIKINSTGGVVLETYLIESKEQKQYNLTNEELFEIYNEIMTNNFFELNETDYFDYVIYDGNGLSLMVKADGQEHKVTISYGHLEQIDNITEKIMEILIPKDNGLDKMDVI